MTKIEREVKKLYNECGMYDPLDLSIKEVIQSKNILVKEEPMDGSDGRIVPYQNGAIITVNNKIKYDSRKKFVLAHELGHFILHKNSKKMFFDNQDTLNRWYHDTYGVLEKEANEFAAEFIMPSGIFKEECSGEVFDPEFLDYLSEGFEVSKTAALLRYVKHGNIPVCLVYCKDNKMQWFKRSEGFKYYLEFDYDMPPPRSSVAYELFTKGTIYRGKDRKQVIKKSTWFKVNKNYDSDFYEFCLFVPSYNYSISIIWED